MIEKNKPQEQGRFSLMAGTIFDEEGEIPPIKPKDNVVGLLALLNRLDYESKHLGLDLSVYDGLLGLEDNLIILEKIMYEVNYLGRRNFEKTDDYGRQREERYLISIQKHYEKLFNDCWRLIRQIKEGLK